MYQPRTLPVRPVDPLGTLPMFVLDEEHRQFRCGLCNELVVDEPGELCAPCAEGVLTTKPTRPARSRKAAPRKTATRTTTTRARRS